MKKIFFFILFFAGNIFLANAQYTDLFDFSCATNGCVPKGSLISDGTFLYGMTSNGGANNYGTIFKIKMDGTGYLKLLDFAGISNGKYPQGDLISDGTYLYGMTFKGGLHDDGVIFKIKTNGTGYLKLLDFADTLNGKWPSGSFFSDGIFLYGMTSRGGVNDYGVIFKIKPDGTSFSKLLDFEYFSTGGQPLGTLVSDGTFLYGLTSLGGTTSTNSGCGTIFKIKTDGTAFSKLLNFSGPDGADPKGSLFFDGTYLYGMTVEGFYNNFYHEGNIFKIKTDGTGYSNLMSLQNLISGTYPYGALISDGTFLYGMTSRGGANDSGLVFRIMPDGTGYSCLLDFTGSVGGNGSYPYGSLYSDGNFLYGMTSRGGINDGGTIFKNAIVAGINENKQTNTLSIYPNPSNGIFTLNSNMSTGEISICNLLGEIIFSSTLNSPTTTIDLSNQPNGIYFVTIKSETNSFTQKIIIDK